MEGGSRELEVSRVRGMRLDRVFVLCWCAEEWLFDKADCVVWGDGVGESRHG